ncbi:MAG: Flp pilus assembly protein CpaB [Bacillota bacterium]|nr:Flp pilus assembly protein CpaB [Bacillota bacterium]
MRNRRLLLLLALGSGLLTAVLVYSYTASLTKQARQPAYKMVPIVVARTAIPARTAILPAMLDVKKLPEPAVLPNILRDPKEAVGAVTRDAVVAGEPIIRDRLWPKGQQPGLTFLIPPGRRAVTVAVNEVSGVGGFVKPGDQVDVLATFDKEFLGEHSTVPLLQGVQVLAVAQTMKDDGKTDAKIVTTATLAVTLEEAVRLTLAEERGKLRLALRPAGQEEKVKVRAATAASLRGERAPVPAAAPPAIVRVDKPAGVLVEIIRGAERDVVRVR